MAASIPRTMRAIFHSKAHQTLRLRNDAAVPTPKESEYLLKVGAFAITNGELQYDRPDEPDENIPGLEMAGEVVQGPPAGKFKAGDKVYLLTFADPGTAGEYYQSTEIKMALRPTNVTAAQAASVPISAMTAWQALFVQAGLPSKSDHGKSQSKQPRVLVNGASGAVGLWTVQIAHAAGMYVVGVCSTKNEATVRGAGADEIIDRHKTTILEWAKTNQDGKVDFALDCVGRNTTQDLWHTVRGGGLVLSIVPGDERPYKYTLDRPKGVSESIDGRFWIVDVEGGQLEQITKMIESGEARPIVDSVWKLDDYEKAIARASSGSAVGKVVINVET